MPQPAHCSRLFEGDQDNTWKSPAQADHSSFYHETLSGKYNLLEEDFADVPHRPTRFDYIKEEMEDVRLFSRPVGDEFAILSLQYTEDAVYLNDLKTVEGTLKEPRGLVTTGSDIFFYRLFSDAAEPLYQGSFEIPLRLHFDYFNEHTGELVGGAVERPETDFILKIPLSDKAAQKIILYRQTHADEGKNKIKTRSTDDDRAAPAEVLGEVLF